MKIQIEELGNASCFTYCRKLMENGCNPEEVLEIYRGEMLSYTVSSVGWGATMTVEETNKVGPKFKKYRKPVFKQLSKVCH